MHTPLCGHAQGTVLEYVERAAERGLDQIGFADHCPRYYLSAEQRTRFGDWGMDEKDLERYVREVEQMRTAFAGTVDVKIGLEVDFVLGAEQALQDTIAQYPLDFILGSVHCLPRFGWQHLTQCVEQGPLELYREYFAAVRAAIRSGLFDSIAHPDFIWRYVEWPEGATGEIDDTLCDIVRLAAYAGTALEMNANGYLWSVLAARGNVPNPFRTLLREIAAQHAVVTFGSDAHSPRTVGASLDELHRTAADAGVAHGAQFHRRERSLYSLTD